MSVDAAVTIRLSLALTALIAFTILMLKVFWLGDGVEGATLPAVIVGETAWIGIALVCWVIRHEDHKVRTPNRTDALLILVLVSVGLLQIGLPLKMLMDFWSSIAG